MEPLCVCGEWDDGGVDGGHHATPMGGPVDTIHEFEIWLPKAEISPLRGAGAESRFFSGGVPDVVGRP